MAVTETIEQVTPRGSPPPAEFVGLARQFRAKIAESATASVDRQHKMLRKFRPKRGFTPVPSNKMFDKAIIDWNDLPKFGQLKSRALFDKKSRRCTLLETRIHAGNFGLSIWNSGSFEAAVSIKIRMIEIQSPTIFDDETFFLASIGLHALARRFQRGIVNTDSAVIADLHEIYKQFVESAEPLGEFQIPCAGGTWVGNVVRYGHRPALAVRTFYD